MKVIIPRNITTTCENTIELNKLKYDKSLKQFIYFFLNFFRQKNFCQIENSILLNFQFLIFEYLKKFFT